MKFFVDKVVVLTTEQKITDKWKSRYLDFFSENKVEFFVTKGIGATQNSGNIDESLSTILRHNSSDAVSRDILKNHLAIIQKSIDDRTIQNVMILEDDAIFPNWNNKKWNRIETWLQKNNNTWDIFFLGYCQWPYLFSFMVHQNIVKLTSPLTAHAYILNRSGMEKIKYAMQMEPQRKNQHIDKIYASIPHFNKYGAFPMVSFQEKCPGLYLKACDKLGQRVLFSTWCKWNEWLSFMIPIFLFLMFIILVYWISIKYFH
jgi:hypothetical protein